MTLNSPWLFPRLWKNFLLRLKAVLHHLRWFQNRSCDAALGATGISRKYQKAWGIEKKGGNLRQADHTSYSPAPSRNSIKLWYQWFDALIKLVSSYHFNSQVGTTISICEFLGPVKIQTIAGSDPTKHWERNDKSKEAEYWNSWVC